MGLKNMHPSKQTASSLRDTGRNRGLNPASQSCRRVGASLPGHPCSWHLRVWEDFIGQAAHVSVPAPHNEPSRRLHLTVWRHMVRTL
eukprot:6425396-Amphidinium_carterae.1